MLGNRISPGFVLGVAAAIAGDAGCSTILDLQRLPEPGDGGDLATDGRDVGSDGMVACPPGYAACPSPTNCVDLSTDPSNCGGCGHVCMTTEANRVNLCTNGTCSWACASGFGDCDGNLANGCEAFLPTDPTNCGSCGSPCPDGLNSVPQCNGGTCDFYCGAGFLDCNSSVAGCETSASDPLTCGDCSNACPFAATCSASGCLCDSASVPCGTACSLTSYDPQNCGGCGNMCGTAQGCAMGACQCLPRFTNCGSPSSPLCVDLSTDPANCGMCGHVCGTAGMGTLCSGGLCLTGCGTGLTNCSGACTNTAIDPYNCGMCDHVCSGGAFCEGGCCHGVTVPAGCGPVLGGSTVCPSTCVCPGTSTCRMVLDPAFGYGLAICEGCG